MTELTIRSSSPLGPLRIQLFGPDGAPALKAPELLSASRKQVTVPVPGAGAYVLVATRPSGEALTYPVNITGATGDIDLAPKEYRSPHEFLSEANLRGLVPDVTPPAEPDPVLPVMGRGAQTFRALGAGVLGAAIRAGMGAVGVTGITGLLSGGIASLFDEGVGGAGEEGEPAPPPPPEPEARDYGLYVWSMTPAGPTPAQLLPGMVNLTDRYLHLAVHPMDGNDVRAFGLLDEDGFGPIVIAPPFHDGLDISFLAQGVAASDAAERVGNPSAARVPVAIATPKAPALADLLTGLGAGVLPQAQELWTAEMEGLHLDPADALAMLFHKYDDPAAAILGALFLSRFKPQDAPLPWLRNLADLVPAPIADGKILLAQRLMVGADASAPATHAEIRDLLLEAASRPCCLFAASRSLLTQAMRLYGVTPSPAETPTATPRPGDFLDVAADAGGLEAFWGKGPFAPGRSAAAPVPSAPQYMFRLRGQAFVAWS